MDNLLVGWAEIAGYLRVSKSWVKERRDKLLAAGAINKRMRPRGGREYWGFEADLKEWAKKGGMSIED